MNAKILVFVICPEAIIYLLLYDLHDCTFNACVFVAFRLYICKMFVTGFQLLLFLFKSKLLNLFCLFIVNSPSFDDAI